MFISPIHLTKGAIGTISQQLKCHADQRMMGIATQHTGKAWAWKRVRYVSFWLISITKLKELLEGKHSFRFNSKTLLTPMLESLRRTQKIKRTKSTVCFIFNPTFIIINDSGQQTYITVLLPPIFPTKSARWVGLGERVVQSHPTRLETRWLRVLVTPKMGLEPSLLVSSLVS